MSKQIEEAMALAEVGVVKQKLLAFFNQEGIDVPTAATAMFSLQKDLLRALGANDLAQEFNKSVDKKFGGLKE